MTLSRYRATDCDVCGAALCGAGYATTGVCSRCLLDGARFVDLWCRDLVAAGAPRAHAAFITGVSAKGMTRRLTRARRRS